MEGSDADLRTKSVEADTCNVAALGNVENISDVQELDEGGTTFSTTTEIVGPAQLERQQSIDDDLKQMPAFRFITRPDLYQYAVVGYHFTKGAE